MKWGERYGERIEQRGFSWARVGTGDRVCVSNSRQTGTRWTSAARGGGRGGGEGMKKLILAYVGATSECDLGERSGRELGGAAAHSQEEGAEGGDGGRHDARANRRLTVCAQNKSIQIRARILELLLLPSPHRPPPAAGRCLHIHDLAAAPSASACRITAENV